MLDGAPRLASYAIAECQCFMFGEEGGVYNDDQKESKGPRRITKETTNIKIQKPGKKNIIPKTPVFSFYNPISHQYSNERKKKERNLNA